jgi:predicted site-specific integrase-resolvase
MPGAMLTQSEAAKYLGRSRDKVREWTRNGLIPVLYDPESSRPMYPLPALEAWMQTLGADHARRAS